MFALLRRAALQSGWEAPALIEGETRWSYGQWVSQAKALAQLLQSEHRLEPGQKVALLFYSQADFLIAFYALRWVGAIPVPINLGMPPEDIAFVFKDAGIVGVLADTELATLMAPKLMAASGGQLSFWIRLNQKSGELPLSLLPTFESIREAQETSLDACWGESPPYQPATSEELAFLLYTSGTTAHPKGVMLSEANILSNLEALRDVLLLNPPNTLGRSDCMLLGLPLFHSYGLTCAFMGLSIPAPLVMLPKFQPKRLIQDLQENQVTIMPLVPTFFSVLSQLAARLPETTFASLRFCISGGAALPKALLEETERVLGAPVLEGYGLTETSPVIAVNSPQDGSRHRSVGRPLSNLALRIRTDEAPEAPVSPMLGTVTPVGEIEVKGPSVMQGYFNRPEENTSAFTEDGWFKTGDLGYVDAEGFLYISDGRKKDLIIKAGENIAPARIEQVLLEHEMVGDAAVFGIPDQKLGELIVAYVQPSLGSETALDTKALQQSLVALCRAQLPPFMQPDRWEVTSELPKSVTGKIVKKELKARYLNTVSA
jgi:long-chain acyl-CoA synthetase